MQGFRKKALPAAISLALGTGALAPVAAHAGWYVGAGAGQSSFDDDAITTSELADEVATIGDIDNVSVDVDDSDTGFKVFGGYRFNDFVALEAAYVDLGSIEASISGDGTFDGGEGSEPFSFSGSASADVKGYGVNAIVGYPVLGLVNVFASVGAFRWESDASGSITATDGIDSETYSASASDDGIDIKYGVGARMTFLDHLGVQVEWENYDVGSSDVDLLSASVSWEF